MGTLAEYGMLMMAMAIILSLMIPSAIEPFQARMEDVRNASLAVSEYRLVASLENTSSWIVGETPKWYFGEGLACSTYSVIGEDSSGTRFALSPKAKAEDPSLTVPSTTCANFYAPGRISGVSAMVRVFSVPCKAGTYNVTISENSNICPEGCTITVQCSGNSACEIQWSRQIGRLVVRETVQFVP